MAEIYTRRKHAPSDIHQTRDVSKVNACQRLARMFCFDASQLFSEALRCTDTIGYSLLHLFLLVYAIADLRPRCHATPRKYAFRLLKFDLRNSTNTFFGTANNKNIIAERMKAG